MGTRNLTMVIDKEGTTRVAQYCQYDGYPGGQGEIALVAISEMNLDVFNKKLQNCSFLTEEEAKVLDDNYEKSMEEMPWLDRDWGAKILNGIYKGELIKTHYRDPDILLKVNIEKLIDSSEFAADSLFCEWAYVIDLQKVTFEVYKGFPIQFRIVGI